MFLKTQYAKDGLSVRAALCLGTPIIAPFGVMVPTANAADMPEPETIVITATKRDATVQEVPLSVQALSGDFLSEIAASSFADYVKLTPGLSLNDRGSSRAQLSIRGISSPSPATASTVGVYIDETPVSTANIQPNPFLFDVDRIEILRGPQGTLYGEGALGGVVRVIPKQPDPTAPSVAFDTQYGDVEGGGEAYGANLMVNMPIVSDRVALRTVLSYDDSGDFIENTANNTLVGGEERLGGRVALGAQLMDRLTSTISYAFQDTEANGARIETPGAGDRRQTRQIVDIVEDDFNLGTIAFDYAGDGFNVISSTSYFDRDYAAVSDNQAGADSVAALAELLFVLPSGALGGLFSSDTVNNFEYEIFNHETRVATDWDGPLNFVAGFFYSDRERITEFNSNIFAPALPPFLPTPQTLKLFEIDTVEEIEEFALFGEFTYAITDALNFTGGVRWFDNSTDLTREGSSFDLLTQVGTPVPNIPISVSDSGATYKVAVDYSFTESLLGYVSVSTGYRRGGANQLSPSDIPGGYESDETTNYELGVKKTFADGRMFFNAAAYYIDWQDLQVELLQFSPLAQADIGFTDNAGAAHSLGAEVEVFGQVTDAFSINFGASVVEAELDEPAQGGLEGDRIPNTPEYKVGLNAKYDFALTENLDAYVLGGFEAVSSKVANIGAPGTVPEMGAYELFDLRAGVTREAWSFEVFAENLTDESVELFIDSTTGDIFRNQPRTVGARLRANFD